MQRLSNIGLRFNRVSSLRLSVRLQSNSNATQIESEIANEPRVPSYYDRFINHAPPGISFVKRLISV